MFWQDELSLPDVRELSLGDLVALGECSHPDTDESPGAEFLGYVKRDVIEALEDENWAAGLDQDAAYEKATEIANATPSHHNYTRWMEAGDLAAWDEEPESGEWPDVLIDAVGVALYQIAERIANGIFERYIAWRDSQEDEDESFEDDEDEDGDDLLPANAGSSE